MHWTCIKIAAQVHYLSKFWNSIRKPVCHMGMLRLASALCKMCTPNILHSADIGTVKDVQSAVVQNNSPTLLSHMLSILNSDRLQHEHCVHGMNEWIKNLVVLRKWNVKCYTQSIMRFKFNLSAQWYDSNLLKVDNWKVLHWPQLCEQMTYWNSDA